jgi:hypothetical protein
MGKSDAGVLLVRRIDRERPDVDSMRPGRQRLVRRDRVKRHALPLVARDNTVDVCDHREPWKLPTPSSSRVSNQSQTPTVLSQRSVVKRATSGSA